MYLFMQNFIMNNIFMKIKIIYLFLNLNVKLQFLIKFKIFDIL